MRYTKYIMLLSLVVMNIVSLVFVYDAIDRKNYKIRDNFQFYHYIDASRLLKNQEDYDEFVKIAEQNKIAVVMEEVGLTYLDPAQFNKILKKNNLSMDLDYLTTDSNTADGSKIHDFLNNDHYKIRRMTWDDAKDKVLLILSQGNQFASFKQSLVNYFDIDSSYFVMNQFGYGSNDLLNLSISILILLMIVTTIIIITSSIFYFFSETKKIAVMSLIGYQTRTIYFSLIKPTLLSMGSISMVSTLLLVAIVGIRHVTFFVYFFSYILFLFVLTISLTYFLMYWLMGRNVKVNLIKNKSETKRFKKVIYAMRIVLIILITILFQLGITSFVGTINSIIQTYRYQEINKYHIIDTFHLMPGDAFLELDGLVEMEFHKKLYAKLQSRYEIYLADFAQREDQDILYGVVNETYVNRQNLQTMDGQAIQLTPDDEVLTLYIPNSIKDDARIEKEKFDQVVIYQDKCLPVYRFDLKKSCENKAVFTTFRNDPRVYINAFGMGINTPLKITNAKSSEEIFNYIHPFLEENGLESLILPSDISTVSQAKNRMFYFNLSYLISLLVFIMISSIFYFLVNRILTNIYFESQSKKFSVMSILGYRNEIILKQWTFRYLLPEIAITIMTSLPFMFKFGILKGMGGLLMVLIFSIVMQLGFNYQLISSKIEKERIYKLRGN